VNGAERARVEPGLLEVAVRRALRADGADRAEISVTLLSDDEIRSLNRTYLERDRPTDVLAFTLDHDPLLGDVYVGVDRARIQADEAGVSLREELVRLAVHGTLHVLGHAHPEGPERLESPMFAVQERIVREVLDARRPSA